MPALGEADADTAAAGLPDSRRPLFPSWSCIPGAHGNRLGGTCKPPSGTAVSSAARAGKKGLAVQVGVELDRRETGGRPVHGVAEGSKPPAIRAALTRIAHVVVSRILGFAHPLASPLVPGRVGAEVVPAAGCGPSQARARDAVLTTALERRREAAVVDIALLDDCAVCIMAPPPAQVGRVFPQTRHAEPMNLVEGLSQEVLRVTRREREAGRGGRVETVDVVQLNGVEPLPGAHPEALVQHRPQGVQLAQVDPPLLRVAVVDAAQGGG